MCLRLTYFNEWDYQADVKKVYDVVAWYNPNRGVRDAGRETLLPFTSHDAPAKDKQLYVLSSTHEGEFIAANRLKVVYRGETTDVVVAVPAFVPACFRPRLQGIGCRRNHTRRNLGRTPLAPADANRWIRTRTYNALPVDVPGLRRFAVGQPSSMARQPPGPRSQLRMLFLVA